MPEVVDCKELGKYPLDLDLIHVDITKALTEANSDAERHQS